MQLLDSGTPMTLSQAYAYINLPHITFNSHRILFAMISNDKLEMGRKLCVSFLRTPLSDLLDCAVRFSGKAG